MELNYISWATTAAAVGYAIYLTVKSSATSSAETKTNNKINAKVDLGNSKVVTNLDIEDFEKKAVLCRCWKSSKVIVTSGSIWSHLADVCLIFFLQLVPIL